MAGRPASIHLETAYAELRPAAGLSSGQEAPVAAIARVTQLLLLAHQRRIEAQGGAAPHTSAQDSNPAEVKAVA